MDHFNYHEGTLFAENMDVHELLKEFGSPLYVYSATTFEEHYTRIQQAFAKLNPTICYAIKSCDNIHICKLLASLGAGMDVVSGGEIVRAKYAGTDMAKVVYAGVGKTDDEIRLALSENIGFFNIESEQEFENIAKLAAEADTTANAALRINPDVDPETAHAKTTTGKKESKFGVDFERALAFFKKYGKDKHLHLNALHMHIGSPVYHVEPYENAVKRGLELIAQLQGEGFEVQHLDIGGGFGADYESGRTPAYEDYAKKIVPLLKPFVEAGGHVLLEPGRTISANAGILLTTVQYIKQGGSKKFVIIDSGMHHMIRPTLYESFQFIWPTQANDPFTPKQRQIEMDMPGLETVDVVGPICETGDYLAKDRAIPPVQRGDALAVFGAGAYGKVMSSNYNTMPRPAEILVRDRSAKLIRRRETYEDLLMPEMELEEE